MQNQVLNVKAEKLKDDVKSFYSELIDALNKKGIRYCLLRDTDLQAPDLDELDLLIWPEHRPEFEAVMRELNFTPRKLGIPRKEVFACFSGGKLRLLDVHYAFIQDGIVYMPLAGVYGRLAKTPEGFKTLPAEDQLLHLFYHNLIGKKHLQSKHLPLIKQLLAGSPDLDYLKNQIPSTAINKMFERFLEDPLSFANNRKMAARAAKKIRRALTLRSPANWFRSFYNRSLKQLFHRRRGVHFAFMGVDGAGKSTVIKAVQKQLQEAGKIKFYNVYMGPWGEIRSPMMRAYRKARLGIRREDWSYILRQKLKGQEKKHSYIVIMYKLLSSTLQGWFYYIFLYSEFWYRYFRDVRPKLKKGAIVLSDRYIYDVRYIYKDRPMKQFNFMRRLVCRFYPSPNRIVYLHNTAEIIRSRKPQLGADEIRQFQGFYRKALAKHPLMDIKTDQPPDVLAQRIVKSIMSCYLGQDTSL